VMWLEQGNVKMRRFSRQIPDDGLVIGRLGPKDLTSPHKNI
jgi:hypothetical protein